jgi:CMP-2-keto-3-deoxyoctulosonic acid synthetase
VLTVETQFDSIGVDTPDDLERVRAILERDDVPVIAR